MSRDSESNGIGAGRAYIEKFGEQNPLALSAARSVAQLRVFGDAVKAVSEAQNAALEKASEPCRAIERAKNDAFKAIADGIAETNEELRRETAQLLEEYEPLIAAEEEKNRALWQSWGAAWPGSDIAKWESMARRVGVSADRVLDGEWTPGDIRNLAEGYFQSLQDRAAARKQPDKTAGKKKPKRSWTQLEVNRKIAEHKANTANYHELVNLVAEGTLGATKAARKLFGRNAIAAKFGIPPAMVTKSTEWQGIADVLGLAKRSGSPSQPRPTKIGLDIAIEKQGEAAAVPAIDQAIRRETIKIVKAAMERVSAEATIEKLDRGDMSDDQARELADIYKKP